MAVVPGPGPGQGGFAAPGLEIDDDGRAGGEGAVEVGEIEPFAEVGRKAEFAGDAQDVERVGAGLRRAVQPGDQTVLALLDPPIGEDGLEGGCAAGVAVALADVGDGQQRQGCRVPGKRNGRGSRMGEAEGKERAGEPSCGDGEEERGGFLHRRPPVRWRSRFIIFEDEAFVN